MKQLPRVCCVITLALMVTACNTVPKFQERLSNLDLDAETYIVRAGDTLESVAFRYKLTPSELAALNPGVGRNFPPGTELYIRSASRSGETYQAETVWSQSDQEPLPQRKERDRVYTSPVVTPNAESQVTYEPVQRSDDEIRYEEARRIAEVRQLEEIRRLEADRLYEAEAQRIEETRLRDEEVRRLELLRRDDEARRLELARRDEEATRLEELRRYEEARRLEDTSGASAANFPAPVSAVVSDIALLESRPTYQSDDLSVSDSYLNQGGNVSARNEVVEEVYDAGSVEMSQATGLSQSPSIGPWTWPTEGQIARGFSPIKEGRHGVDIAGVPGQPVVAAMDGIVAYSGKDPSGSGNLIIVKHKGSLLSAYSHTRDLYVAENDTVNAGDPIGTLGWNSRQESVLRFEVRKDGNSLNPMEFLSAR